MAEESKKPGPFDIDTVRQLVELMDKHDVSEVSLKDGDRVLRLRRGATLVAAAPAPMMPAMMPAAAPMASGAGAGASATPTPAAAPVSKLLEIKSPMVGTFYAKPSPEKDDYVRVGSRVTGETVVCKIEAMKIFNDLQAGLSGTIAEILVQNGQFVEYDQVLFRVDPA